LKTEDFKYCRNSFEKGATSNLIFLLNKRYSFIKENIKASGSGVEFGAGAGLSSYFLKGYNILISDFCNSDWLSGKNIDAMNSGLPSGNFDYVLVSNVIHHLDKPRLFFDEALRILKPGGKIIIIEPYSSLLMRIFLRIKKHEQVINSVYPLDEEYSFKKYAKSEKDGNNAVGKMLFKKPDKFLKKYPGFEIIKKSCSEFSVFLNSGGQYSKSPYIPLPFFILKLSDLADKLVISVLPGIFALGIYVVIRKK